MTRIKFDKSVKYQGVRYAAHEAFMVDNAEVDELKKAGAIVLLVEPDDAPEQPSEEADEDSTVEHEQAPEEQENGSREDVAQLKEALLEYTVPELTKFAQERSIDLQKKTKKAEIYNIIVAALD